MPRKLRQTTAALVAAGMLTAGCTTATASTGPPDDAELIPSPPTICETALYGRTVTCEQAKQLQVVVTVWWLRWYGYWAAAARYATAVYHARQAQASIHGHPWLACIRARESGGNYTIYNTTGSGASGAYQFMPGTWAWMSRQAGYGAWAGSPAASAPPHVQDAVAYWAYAHGYQSHWVTAGPGGC